MRKIYKKVVMIIKIQLINYSKELKSCLNLLLYSCHKKVKPFFPTSRSPIGLSKPPLDGDPFFVLEVLHTLTDGRLRFLALSVFKQ